MQQQQQLQNKDKGEQQTLIITKNLDQQEGTSNQFEHRSVVNMNKQQE
jgi:hypothetical protein